MPKNGDQDPIELVRDWLAEAKESEPVNPTAAALATADASGAPSVRMVLVRGLDASGMVFYTNLESRKALDLAVNPRAALCFYWKSMGRQLRAEGPLALVADDEADAYFASRDRGSRIGAWASKQSRPLESRRALEKQVAKFTAKFGAGEVPRPEFWSGFRLAPEMIEFWSQGTFRLHQRVVYRRKDGDGGDGGDDAGWTTERLYP
jgi:pyridoxamine 5'-phosphate oxidase